MLGQLLRLPHRQAGNRKGVPLAGVVQQTRLGINFDVLI